MTQQKFTHAILREHQQLVAQLPRNSLLDSIREAALKNFEAREFPTRKSELFSYVDLRLLAEERYALLSLHDQSCPPSEDLPANRLVFVNGFFHQGASQYACKKGAVEVLPLTEMDAARAQYLMRAYQDETDYFALLAGVFMHQGACVRVCGEQVEDLHVLEYSYGDGGREGFGLNVPCVMFEVEKGLACRVVHTYLGEGRYYNGSVWDVCLKEDARLDYLRMQWDAKDSVHMSALRVCQERNSEMNALCMSHGGLLVRSACDVRLREGASFSVKALNVLHRKENAHYNIRVSHEEPRTKSDQLFRNVLMEEAHVSVDTTVHVHAGAHHSDSRQMLHNLVLSDQAHADMKPNLTIYADDVKCAHGAVLGQVREEELLYLMSRGIARRMAKQLLIESFVRELLVSLEVEHVEEIQSRLLFKLKELL